MDINTIENAVHIVIVANCDLTKTEDLQMKLHQLLECIYDKEKHVKWHLHTMHYKLLLLSAIAI